MSIIFFLSCTAAPPADSGVASLVGPDLAHTAPSAAVESATLDFTVTASDPDGVASVELFHRPSGIDDWVHEPMTEGEGDVWSVSLGGTDVVAPGVEYYFKARDSAEASAVSYLPATATRGPYLVDVVVEGRPFPFSEDFEVDPDESSLRDLAWANASLGFRDVDWTLTSAHEHAGAGAVYHFRGADGIDAIDDWLLSPAIDLSATPDAQVTWFELGVNIAAVDHGLYVSTTSRNPDDGGFVAVAEVLPGAPDGEWAKSAIYDLSAWVGEPTVYLAWRYRGSNADDWYIDDVSVSPLASSLAISLGQSALAPGGGGELTVTVQNTSGVDALDVAVVVTLGTNGVTLAAESVDVGGVGAGASADAVFAATVAVDAADNRYYPVTIDVTAADGAWTVAENVLVGSASMAHIEFEPDATGTVEIVLGVGDEAAPTWSTSVYSAVASTAISLDVDITDQYDLLPPGPGDARWWVRVTAENGGQFGDFTLDFDGTSYPSEFIYPVFPGTASYIYVPDPPVLTLLSATSSPSSIDPGTTGISINANIRNDGALTAGAVLATLTTSHADVTVTDAGPIDLGVLDRSDVGIIASGFAFDVAGTHTDSSAISFDLVLDDGAESWTVPLAFDVPFPVLKVTRITIDDDGGDGLLDPGEHAQIDVQVSNTGDESCVGVVTGVLSLAGSSVASADIDPSVASFSTLSAGSSRTARDVDVTATSGSAGDALDLVLTLSDSVRTYEASVRIALSEPPWNALATRDDPVRDVVSGDFDFTTGYYRVKDDVLQIRLESATAFDASRLFVEMWGSSPAGDYDFYNIVLQSGVVYMRGYDSSFGFLKLADPTFSFPDANTIEFDIAIEDMGLNLPEIDFGFGANWCGGDDAYCDHYPDGWGYPYTAWAPSLWFNLSW